jgi:hypothetical protein
MLSDPQDEFRKFRKSGMEIQDTFVQFRKFGKFVPNMFYRIRSLQQVPQEFRKSGHLDIFFRKCHKF